MFYLEDFFYHVASKFPRFYQSGGMVAESAKIITRMNERRDENFLNSSFSADK